MSLSFATGASAQDEHEVMVLDLNVLIMDMATIREYLFELMHLFGGAFYCLEK
ncbi:hypothetical protein HMPREF1210_00109 [Paenisporosarcina sp. HGH0030]|nr:hypothetical protein HMPREF1210_00109 [Paenisporosarcina sp. HGH0030]